MKNRKRVVALICVTVLYILGITTGYSIASGNICHQCKEEMGAIHMIDVNGKLEFLCTKHASKFLTTKK